MDNHLWVLSVILVVQVGLLTAEPYRVAHNKPTVYRFPKPQTKKQWRCSEHNEKV